MSFQVFLKYVMSHWGYHLTPEDWCKRLGVRILDRDGWMRDGKNFKEKIYFLDFLQRFIESTTEVPLNS